MTPLLSRLRVGFAQSRAARLALDVVVAYALFVTAHAVYRGSTGVPQICDSAYTMAAAHQLAATGSLDLTSTVASSELPYNLIRHADPRAPGAPPRVLYGYPLGTVVLTAPFARYYAARGQPALDANGRLSFAAEEALQTRIAARVAAGLVVLFYLVGRAVLPAWAAALVAAGFAFGSPVWSTLARALWSHTWAAVWVSAAIGLLLAARRVERPTARSDALLGVALGTCLFWAAFCRQHAALSGIAVCAYLLIGNRRILLGTIAGGGAWAIALVAFSLNAFGTPTPPSVYATDVIDGRDVAARFAGLLASPSRGLLVYCPYLAVVGGMLVAFRRTLPDRPLLLPAALAVGAHTALFACYNGWHAGSSYGPRYFCDVFPWFVLATALAVRGLLAAGGGRRALWGGALAAAFAWGVWVHGRGANSVAAWHWNHRSLAVGQEESVKEWRHPQFLAGVTFDVHPDGSVTAR